MKKLSIALLMLLCSLLLTVPALADGVLENLTGPARNVLGVSVPVYAEPNTAAMVGSLPFGGVINIERAQQAADQSIWVYGRIAGSPSFSGWVQSSSLRMIDYNLVINPIAGDRLNLRARPSTDAPSLGKFYTGAVVSVEGGSSDEWQKVSVGGLTGYMMCYYLAPVSIDEVINYDDMPPMATINTACTSQSRLDGKSVPVNSYASGTQVLLLGVRADGMALVKPRGLGLMQEIGWVKSSALTPTPSFSSDSSGAQADTSNLMIVVNPDSTDRLNLRESADGRSGSLGKYYTGAVVTVTNTTSSGWALATIGTESGYMDMDYLIPYTDKAAAKYAAMLPTVTVQNLGGTGLNLRDFASPSGDLLQTIPNGASLTVLGITANGWACVQVGDTVGYVLAKWLSPAITFAK